MKNEDKHTSAEPHYIKVKQEIPKNDLKKKN